uniref:BZIP domain-containing protein n=1 Tax=Anopheles maculatus TaxID=74869 RepID=A0A182SS11_9DIPT
MNLFLLLLLLDLCYDDKLKIPSSESVLLGNYGPLPTVVEDEFYDFPLQPEAKAAQPSGPETLMEFESVSGNMELMNHLTPPQTPPQTTSFGGVVGCVLPMQSSLHAVPLPQQQEQFQPLYAPQPHVQSLLQQQQQVSFQGANVTTTTDYYIMDEYSTMTSQQIGAGGNMQQQQQQQQQQQTAVPMEPLQQVPDDIATTSFNFDLNYTPQQLSEMAKIMRSLQLPLEVEEDPSYHDDESCGFSEAGSIENGGDSLSPGSSASSMVAHSPVYSDSAESSAYYGSRSNDGDDEDWSPSKTKKLNVRNGGAVMKKRPNGGSGGSGRGIEEKKSRKKEQNKNAATRYRQKKKAEIEEILIEEEKLRERNDELKSRSQDLGREISCIKKLMREFCRNKGLL